ncbi:MAG TPA: DUF4105 domain-containing protein [Candidatus Paceibacterota bacterium]
MRNHQQPRIFRTILLLLFVLVCIFGASILLTEPRSDRDWLPEYSRTVTAEIGKDAVTIHNVRDWTYNETEPISKEWLTMEVDPKDIVGVWFIHEPFPGRPIFGHTALSFEFNDGSAISFSIEARKETNEKYSPVAGLVNEYELAYMWGTERDFIGLVAVRLDRPIHFYPLSMSPDDAQAIFLAFLEETNTLAQTPRFYNSFSTNCTNTLAHIINEYYPDSLPYDISWTLTGLSDAYLMRNGFIPASSSLEATRARYDLAHHKRAIAEMATSSPEVFSSSIRALIK